MVDNGRSYVNNWWLLTVNGSCALLCGIGFADGTILEHHFPPAMPYAMKYYCFGVRGNTLVSSIDGTLYGTTTFTKRRAVYPRPIELGCRVHAHSFTKIYIAQLLVYRGRMLSAPEIVHNMLNPSNPVRDGLVLWLDARACDPARGVCYDLSGNGNHGTMYNVQVVQLPNPVRVGGTL